MNNFTITPKQPVTQVLNFKGRTYDILHTGPVSPRGRSQLLLRNVDTGNVAVGIPYLDTVTGISEFHVLGFDADGLERLRDFAADALDVLDYA
jgi:hypothetical protein